jgi:AraC family transcriptional regulator
MQPHNLNTRRENLSIRNMVSTSCIRVVTWELQRSGFIQVHQCELGHAEVSYDPQIISEEMIDLILRRNGFALIRNEEDLLVERLKATVIQQIFFNESPDHHVKQSAWLSQRLGVGYAHLSKLFSEKTGTTIEKYSIHIRIEKVKELITYDDLTLSEIAHRMGYSSVQYLSNQFRQVTGTGVSEFKKNNQPTRIPLEQIL